MTIQTKSLFDRANEHLVGGVNSPVRAFKAIGQDPVFFKEGSGAYLTDTQDKKYIDYVLSWGPLILGHAHPLVTEALTQTLQKGTSFGAPTESEFLLAELIHSMMPGLEKIRFVNSGTEATMSAIRLARGFTKRKKIIKFEGCYHGHVDDLLVAAGSGALTLGKPDSDGVLEDTAQHTIVLPYNDAQALTQAFQERGKEIAAVIFEPVAGNMGLILPEDSFLQALQTQCKQNGALLICDEVMTGFRISLGGAQSTFNIKPDITCLGKVIGGGLPCGAYGASKEIMAHISPEGSVYQAGTLSGNPLVMQAGLVTLNYLKLPGVFDSIEHQTQQLCDGIDSLIQTYSLPLSILNKGTMFCLFFRPTLPNSLSEATDSNSELFTRFYKESLKQGLYFAPSSYESGFLSTAHTPEVINATLGKLEFIFNKL